MGRYFPLRQPQGQRQRSLCGTGADQGTVRAGDKELLDIDGIAPGSAKVDRAHRADFIAACGPGNARHADGDVRTGGRSGPQCHPAATGADTTLYLR